MLDCLIMGDSIAVGTHMFKSECVSLSQGGITSHGWDKKFGHNDLSARVVLISLSTNDWERANTLSKLREIRQRVHADRVYWVQPNPQSKPQAVEHVKTVAREFGDTVLVTNRWQPDRIHPSWAGYKQIAREAK